jgi:hypothetical protein
MPVETGEMTAVRAAEQNGPFWNMLCNARV